MSKDRIRQKRLAEELGVPWSTLGSAVRDGRLPADENGLVSRARGLELWPIGSTRKRGRPRKVNP